MHRHQFLFSAGEVAALGAVVGEVIAHPAGEVPAVGLPALSCRLFAARVVNPLPG